MDSAERRFGRTRHTLARIANLKRLLPFRPHNEDRTLPSEEVLPRFSVNTYTVYDGIVAPTFAHAQTAVRLNPEVRFEVSRMREEDPAGIRLVRFLGTPEEVEAAEECTAREEGLSRAVRRHVIQIASNMRTDLNQWADIVFQIGKHLEGTFAEVDLEEKTPRFIATKLFEAGLTGSYYSLGRPLDVAVGVRVGESEGKEFVEFAVAKPIRVHKKGVFPTTDARSLGDMQVVFLATQGAVDSTMKLVMR